MQFTMHVTSTACFRFSSKMLAQEEKDPTNYDFGKKRELILTSFGMF